MKGFYKIPDIQNETVLNYSPGSAEKLELKHALKAAHAKSPEIKMTIGGKKLSGDKEKAIRPPHDIHHSLGYYTKGDHKHVKLAIEAALKAKRDWENTPWEDRAAIFLKAADLLSGPYRQRMNAATMLGQSKNVYQSEIDAVAEMADFFRFNVRYMTEIYSGQPSSAKGVWNKMEYRPLEGFVVAITPFNFTSIAGNLCGAPALLGNTIVWKPAETQIYSANLIMEIFEKAGLPDGVINMVTVDGHVLGDAVFAHPDFAGLHFTGSTHVFQNLWRAIGSNIHKYRSYPRIVGETGGKDFVLAHPSADPEAVATALSRGAFEYQGQKCSAASRAYIPKSLWKQISKKLIDEMAAMKMGSPEDFTNFINAVIDEKAYDKISEYIRNANKSKTARVAAGGDHAKSEGYFIQPTLIVADDPLYASMTEEIFGPILSAYIYDDRKYDEVLGLVNTSSAYALTGAIFAQDRAAIIKSTQLLAQAAGNFYINDKPTGAVVNQQPFGGARASGTNDKAGSVLNLYRWLSPRTIKENFDPPHNFRYPFLNES